MGVHDKEPISDTHLESNSERKRTKIKKVLLHDGLLVRTTLRGSPLARVDSL